MSSLPDGSDPSLCLIPTSPSQHRRVWTAQAPSWGPGFTTQEYVDREAHFLTVPLARNGGLIPWILTDASKEEPIYSSCESIAKRGLYRDPSTGTVKDVMSHGIAGVFTFVECRKRGYGSRMMRDLGDIFEKRQDAQPGSAQFSILYSDIGPNFYGKDGWHAIGNTHLEFNVTKQDFEPSAHVKEITDDMLPELVALDEKLVRAEVAKPNGNRPRVALLPDMDTYEWHFRREDYIQEHFHSRKPTVRGAVYTCSKGRVWALWQRVRYGGSDGYPVTNMLHFLRLAVEDEGISDEELGEALRGIFAAANREAGIWECTTVDTWSPSERIQNVVKDRLPGLSAKMVTRKDHNLASLRWFGEGGDAKEVDWVVNEKYAWC